MIKQQAREQNITLLKVFKSIMSRLLDGDLNDRLRTTTSLYQAEKINDYINQLKAEIKAS